MDSDDCIPGLHHDLSITAFASSRCVRSGPWADDLTGMPAEHNHRLISADQMHIMCSFIHRQ